VQDGEGEKGGDVVEALERVRIQGLGRRKSRITVRQNETQGREVKRSARMWREEGENVGVVMNENRTTKNLLCGKRNFCDSDQKKKRPFEKEGGDTYKGVR